jgi:hypothetical protein
MVNVRATQVQVEVWESTGHNQEHYNTRQDKREQEREQNDAAQRMVSLPQSTIRLALFHNAWGHTSKIAQKTNLPA